MEKRIYSELSYSIRENVHVQCQKFLRSSPLTRGTPWKGVLVFCLTYREVRRLTMSSAI